MTMFVSSFMFIALFAIGLAHFIWALGRTWPIRDRKLLAQTVVGTAGIESVPRLASLLIALFAFGAGIFALALADHDSGGLPMTLAGYGFALLFLGRGALGYSSGWRQRHPEPNFRLNDARVYSPLCLFIGAGFTALALMRML